jgi:hypothetical protein
MRRVSLRLSGADVEPTVIGVPSGTRAEVDVFVIGR